MEKIDKEQAEVIGNQLGIDWTEVNITEFYRWH